MRRMLLGLLTVTILVAAKGSAETTPPPSSPTPGETGVLCIAPFHEPTDHGPNMSEATWPPAADSKFEFRVDRKTVASVKHGEMASAILPLHRVMLGVRLDGKPFESFPIELAKEPDHRLCLWLYPDYWRWINQGWEHWRGCRCGEDTPPSK